MYTATDFFHIRAGEAHYMCAFIKIIKMCVYVSNWLELDIGSRRCVAIIMIV